MNFFLLIVFHVPCQHGLTQMNCGCGGIQTLVSLQSVTHLLIFKTSRLQETTLMPCIKPVKLTTGRNSVSSTSFTGKELHDHKDSV